MTAILPTTIVRRILTANGIQGYTNKYKKQRTVKMYGMPKPNVLAAIREALISNGLIEGTDFYFDQINAWTWWNRQNITNLIVRFPYAKTA